MFFEIFPIENERMRNKSSNTKSSFVQFILLYFIKLLPFFFLSSLVIYHYLDLEIIPMVKVTNPL